MMPSFTSSQSERRGRDRSLPIIAASVFSPAESLQHQVYQQIALENNAR
jgi:hypothetical protein